MAGLTRVGPIVPQTHHRKVGGTELVAAAYLPVVYSWGGNAIGCAGNGDPLSFLDVVRVSAARTPAQGGCGRGRGKREREGDFSYEEVKVLLQPTKWSKVLHSSVLRIRVDVTILNFLYGPGSNQEPEKQVRVHNGEGVIRH